MTDAAPPRPRAPAASAVRLEACAISKRFGATRALTDLSFEVRPGELHALCGENGAGKSTLIKVLAGIYPHGTFEGEVRVEGAPRKFRGVRDAEQAGIAVIHQELALVPELTAAENVFLGHEPTRLGLIDQARMLRETRTLLARFGASIDAGTKVGSLGVGQAQLVEIARALHKNARVLILDEPTAALSEREASSLFDVLRELRQEGVSLIYISHRLREVFALSDRITVLRDGRSITSTNTTDTSEAEVVRHMVGRALSSVFPARKPPVVDAHGSAREQSAEADDAPLLQVDGLSADHGKGVRLRDISFRLRAGEVLGIGGLVGAGRSELLMHLFGAWGTRRAGTVVLAGSAFASPSPATSIARGMVLVGEDRKQTGLVLAESIGFNLTLSHLAAFATRGFVRAHDERAAQEQMAAEVQLVPPRLALPAGALSGGNQQKVVLGRALMTAPRVLLLDEPTRGVDVGAKAEIYALIARLCEAGLGVVLVTSELPELIGLADRILMLVEGRVGGHFARAEATEERLLAAALSHSQGAPA